MSEQKKESCLCPYCDAEMTEEDLPCCLVCNVSLFYCPQCGKPLHGDSKVCSHCGADARGEVT
jgi:hypothetical protein